MNRTFRTGAALVLGALLLAAAPALQAQDYPNRQVRAIVGYPPGGSVDTNARLLGVKLSELWGQSVVIDNRGGAGSTIGTAAAANATPDGYSFLIASPAHAINATLYKKLPYDTEAAFVGVAQLSTSPLLLLVHPSVPANSVRELIALAREKSASLNYGSSGNGTSVHLSGALFNMLAGVNITHVPYNGGGPAMTALMAGTTQIMFGGVEGLAHVKAGKLRVLGVTTPKRVASMPEVPTVAEAGLPGYEVEAWYGVYVPAATPRNIINKLNADINKVLNTADGKERFARAGFGVVNSTPEQFHAFNKAEIDKWRKVITSANVNLD